MDKVTETVLTVYYTCSFCPVHTACPVHIAVVLRKHVSSPLELDDALLLEPLSVVKQISGDALHRYGAPCILTSLGRYRGSKHLLRHDIHGEVL